MERHRPRKLRAKRGKRRPGARPRAKLRPRRRLHRADQPRQPGLGAVRRPSWSPNHQRSLPNPIWPARLVPVRP